MGHWLYKPLITVSQLAESCQLVMPKEGAQLVHTYTSGVGS